jgi:hypothetical protein
MSMLRIVAMVPAMAVSMLIDELNEGKAMTDAFVGEEVGDREGEDGGGGDGITAAAAIVTSAEVALSWLATSATNAGISAGHSGSMITAARDTECAHGLLAVLHPFFHAQFPVHDPSADRVAHALLSVVNCM